MTNPIEVKAWPTYDASATIVYRGGYDYDLSAYKTYTATALQVSEVFATVAPLRSAVEVYKSQHNSLRDFLIENLESGDISPETAQEISEIFGIELSKTYQVTMQVEYTATISVPIGDEPSEDDFDIRIDYNGTDGNAETDDYSIESFDFEETF